ncbi:MAG: Tryptophan-rich sensory protein, partial [uncultured Chloroflexi bacterium]
EDLQEAGARMAGWLPGRIIRRGGSRWRADGYLCEDVVPAAAQAGADAARLGVRSGVDGALPSHGGGRVAGPPGRLQATGAGGRGKGGAYGVGCATGAERRMVGRLLRRAAAWWRPCGGRRAVDRYCGFRCPLGTGEPPRRRATRTLPGVGDLRFLSQPPAVAVEPRRGVV